MKYPRPRFKKWPERNPAQVTWPGADWPLREPQRSRHVGEGAGTGLRRDRGWARGQPDGVGDRLLDKGGGHGIGINDDGYATDAA